MAEIGYADRRKEIRVITDTKLPKEPDHCHLIYKGVTVGCILLEDETKGKMFERKEKKLFQKKQPLPKFSFVPEIDDGKLNALLSLFQKEWGNNTAMGADTIAADYDMIFVSRKFAVKQWGSKEEFAKFARSTLNGVSRFDLIDFIAKELKISAREAQDLLEKNA